MRGSVGAYQSMDWGGSSFECEVLTVSTQPGVWRIRVSFCPFMPFFSSVLLSLGVVTDLGLGVFLVSSRKPSMR